MNQVYSAEGYTAVNAVTRFADKSNPLWRGYQCFWECRILSTQMHASTHPTLTGLPIFKYFSQQVDNNKSHQIPVSASHRIKPFKDYKLLQIPFQLVGHSYRFFHSKQNVLTLFEHNLVLLNYLLIAYLPDKLGLSCF